MVSPALSRSRPARPCTSRIWVHRSVNVGDDPFVTLFCYAADAGQNYGLIADAGGMAQLVVAEANGGWTTRPNPDHMGYRMEAY